ncbi:hypothetical protein GDO86_001801 [Hymenochirus boettgeri]|uniref:Hermansky-Pudlak syndrome 4 protein n=1 Tax=Hymenochirus boettgeri TaxID=247094 RepID=A0A8T2KIK5_9PIPI|nr:hypothetical protein GDO86_001801 [Hymenochirus boettgeri]KAG8455745.1 hypothetical protein GDO86_001801 [Hymenochirus boettgeri]
MASSVSAEHSLTSWLNYFFLYDGSKVKGEGDPTRAGINYFYPPQTLVDQQELLCGQIAGVVRCMSEISNSSPNLIRLRKMKFAIFVEEDYLWALGCSPDIVDVSCKQFLRDLIGLFRFYNGPLTYAYKVRTEHDLNAEWSLYIEFIQSNTNELHRVFNSLSHLDKTKVDPLLLLKAALILQTCQRFPHVLAGCIRYKSCIVSTQLSPAITSKILIQRDRLVHTPTSVNSHVLPKDVCLIPVFLMEEEANEIRQYPALWMSRAPNSTRSDSELSHSPTDEVHRNPFSVSMDTTVLKKTRTEKSSLVDFPVEPDPSQLISKDSEDVGNRDAQSLILNQVVESLLPSSSLFSSSIKTAEFKDIDSIGDKSERAPFDASIVSHNVELLAEKQNAMSPDKDGSIANSGHLSTSSFLTCDSLIDMENKEHDLETFEDYTPVFLQDSQTDGDHSSQLQKRTDNVTDQIDAMTSNTCNLEDVPLPIQTTDISFSPKLFSISNQTLSLGPSHSPINTKLVQMILYIHNVKGLVLSLLAECPFNQNIEYIQDVYDSTLASLNGLEVHLKETLPVDNSNTIKSTHSFTHYDSIQNIFTANLPSASNTHDRHFFRAASLIHSDFKQHHSFQEMTVRNASSAVYACQSAVHETYFQQLAPPIRNSGVPDPQDSAFILSNKAKQKLLKHGLNLL